MDDLTALAVVLVIAIAGFIAALAAMQGSARATNAMQPLGPPTGPDVTDRHCRIAPYTQYTYRAPVYAPVPLALRWP
jgi:hypothetical protein